MTSPNASFGAPHAAGVTVDPALTKRIADLTPRWQYAISKAASRNWHIFPLQDSVRPVEGFQGEDWSKRPRPRCPQCRTAKVQHNLRPEECYADCGHALCHGLLGATSNVDQLTAWAQQFPRANTAVATGIKSNLFVLDVDGQAGLDRLAELTRENGPLNDTLEHRTGGGTPHKLFDYPSHRANPSRADGQWRNNARTLLGPGLDTRGEGGYVVLPGSVSRKGLYEVTEDRPQGKVNDWLLDKLGTRERPASVHSEHVVTVLTAAPRLGLATVHPYAAACFQNRVADFRSLNSTGMGRSNQLYGAALYLSGIVNHPGGVESGLTEDMIRDGLGEAAQANGYATTRVDYMDTIENGIVEGRRLPARNWPPADPLGDTFTIVRTAVTSGDTELLNLMRVNLGVVEFDALVARIMGDAR